MEIIELHKSGEICVKDELIGISYREDQSMVKMANAITALSLIKLNSLSYYNYKIHAGFTRESAEFDLFMTYTQGDSAEAKESMQSILSTIDKLNSTHDLVILEIHSSMYPKNLNSGVISPCIIDFNKKDHLRNKTSNAKWYDFSKYTREKEKEIIIEKENNEILGMTIAYIIFQDVKPSIKNPGLYRSYLFTVVHKVQYNYLIENLEFSGSVLF
jgi:hypothetical protein